MPKYDYDRVVRLYVEEDMTQREVSEVVGCSESYISQILSKKGVDTGHKYKCEINHQSFSELDPETEYWIGFLMADGSVIKRGPNQYIIELKLASKDKKHLVKFKDFLDSEHKIRNKKESDSSACSITFNSNKIAKDLSEYGVKPNKTYNAIASEKVKGSRHFWRGVVDGDGSIFKSNGSFYIALYGSRDICEQFRNWQIDFGSDNSVKTYSGNACYMFRAGGSTAENIVKELYRDCSVYLNRKMEIAKEVLNN